MKIILQTTLGRAIAASLFRPYRASEYFDVLTQGGASLALGYIISGLQPEAAHVAGFYNFQPEAVHVTGCSIGSHLSVFAPLR